MTHWNSLHNTLAAYAGIRIGCQTFFNNFQHTSAGRRVCNPETKDRSDDGETVSSHGPNQVNCHRARFVKPSSSAFNQLRLVNLVMGTHCLHYSAELPGQEPGNQEPGGEFFRSKKRALK